jgi:hypothetical protein
MISIGGTVEFFPHVATAVDSMKPHSTTAIHDLTCRRETTR